ncbi:MAG: nitroreductase family deazaflavin-dependent oxidoreductase [Chloroflexi bacterium]|nr:nitroreductase family deazaflavin-dependent oxidoreductase [Chloroflexota bacterium]
MPSKVFFKAMTVVNNAVYRATGGRVGGKFGTLPVVLVTVTGRKTGKRRTLPLGYLADGDRYVLVASKGGAPAHPDWFLNMMAKPEVIVRHGRRDQAMVARQASLEEKASLWPRLLKIYPPYQDYQKKTSRDIPVVILEPKQ